MRQVQPALVQARVRVQRIQRHAVQLRCHTLYVLRRRNAREQPQTSTTAQFAEPVPVQAHTRLQRVQRPTTQLH